MHKQAAAMTRRPGKPGLACQLTVILRQQGRCGCGCGYHLAEDDIEWDHRPPLMHRNRNPDNGKYTPDANDPNYIEALTSECHAHRTFGRGGEKRITTRGSDIGEAAREKSQRESHLAHVARMAGEPVIETRKARIPSRPFPKQQRKLRSKHGR